MKTTFSSRRGAALIIVLGCLVLLSILVVGLAVATRMERSASFFNLERTRAELMARQGIDSGMAILMEATATNRYWISGPGRIWASPTNTFDLPSDFIALSSGYTDATNADVSSDLNRRSLDGADRLLDPSGTNFNFQWIYVQSDGGYTNIKNVNTVGRFAFWIDDESTKVDLNTAEAKSNPLTSSPSQISLGALPGLGAFAGEIASEANITPFTTPLDILGRNPTWTNALVADRFYLTYYTQDPDVNPWGEPRIVLTTRTSNAPNRRFLNILASANSDPGIFSNLSPGLLQTTYAAISSNLIRTNWPYAPGNSFVSKFGTNGVSQLAIDIIEYVRSTESTNLWIDPIIAIASTNSISLLPPSTGLEDIHGGVMIGTARRPMLSQVGVFCSTNHNVSGTGFLGTVHVQTWLPASYNAGPGPFSGWTFWAQVASSSGTTTNTVSFALPAVSYLGGYATHSITNVDIPADIASGIPMTTRVRLALLKSPTASIRDILDIAPLKEGDFITCSTATNVTAYSSINDPRVNKYAANWSNNTNLVGNALPGSRPINYSAYIGVPPSDGSPDSVFMRRTNSTVTTIGELGYITTGVNSEPNAPWRSVRFQTNSSASINIPPDWALMDLFSVPIAARYLPGTNLIAGRVNLNVAIPGVTNSSRTNVLNALFTNFPFTPPSTMSSVVSNIANARLASGGRNFGNLIGSTNLVSIGQLSEIADLGDRGEAGEEMVRQVAGFVTVRGNVFGIYSCGQAIKVSSSGKVTINGEKILHGMVERHFDATGTAKYRIISWSEISP